MKYSIIIPSYNHLEDCLRPCLDSVLQYTDLVATDGEIIIVLNGCIDGSRGYTDSLRLRYGDRVRVLWSDDAMGYTRAVNWGIREAIGEYLVLLNNDVVILWDGDWLGRLLGPFSDSGVAVTGVSRILDRASGWDFIIFYCAVIRSDLVRLFGGLDEVFNPGGGEDIEYCIRMRKLGYKIRSVGDSSAVWGYSTDFPIFHSGERTVWELPDWDSIWDKNQELLRDRYREDVRYSIYIDNGVGFDSYGGLVRCVDSIWNASVMSGLEICGCDRNRGYWDKLGKSQVVRVYRDDMDWMDDIESRGVVGILLFNDVVVTGDNSDWIRDLDRGVGRLYDYAIGDNWKICYGGRDSGREWKYSSRYIVSG